MAARSLALAPAAVLALALLAARAAPVAAADTPLAGRTYHFGVHEARTTIVFHSEADLETIHGVTHKMSGSATLDASGTSARADLAVEVASLRTGIDLRDEHLRSEQWLDAKRHPTIRLAIEECVRDADGRAWSWKGKVTIKGRTKAVSGAARVTVIPDELGKQLGAGSWIRVRTGFDVKLSDFGIEVPESVGAKVSEVWPVKVDLYASTEAPRR